MADLNDAIRKYNEATSSANPSDKLNYLKESEKYLESYIKGNPSDSFAKSMSADVNHRIAKLEDELKPKV